MKTKDFKDRLKVVMKHYKLTEETLADKLGVPQATLGHLLLGRNVPTINLLDKLITEYPDISPKWLINGSGEMIEVQNKLNQ